MLEDEYLALLENEKTLIEEEISKYLKIFGKKYVLDSRIKNPEKVRIKQEYLRIKGRPNKITDIDDIIGFRISAENDEDLLSIKAFLERTLFCEYEMVKCVDFYSKPKETGYKAYNIFFISTHGICFEIQMMTEDIRKWTNSTHKEHDIRKYGRIRYKE